MDVNVTKSEPFGFIDIYIIYYILLILYTTHILQAAYKRSNLVEFQTGTHLRFTAKKEKWMIIVMPYFSQYGPKKKKKKEVL